MHHRDAEDRWARLTRDPYVLLLAGAAAIQLAFGFTAGEVARPGWALAGVMVFLGAVVVTVTARVRRDRRLHTAAPYLLIVVTACWRVADSGAASGLGGLVLVTVIWLALLTGRAHVAAGILLGAIAITVPQLVVERMTTDDWLHAALTLAVAVLVGPTINSLVRRGALASARASALEPAGSRLDAVLRAARGHMIVVTDLDGTIVEFNSGAERLLGWSAAEVVGVATPVIWHDEQETRRRAAELGIDPGMQVYVHPARDGDVDVRDWVLVAKDGTRRIVSLSITGMHDADGRLCGYVGVGNDVTEIRSATARLAAQQEIYRLLVENLPLTTVGLYDAQLRCVTIGGHWPSKAGFRADDLVGRHVSSLFSPEDAGWGVALFGAALNGPVEARRRLSGGASYELSALPLTGPDGSTMVLSLARDITAQHAAETERAAMVEALAMSESNFREAFEHAPIGLALTSADADERFLRVNSAFAAILGRTPDELTGLRMSDLTHPADVGLTADPAADPTAEADGSRVVRKRFLRPSGRSVWVEATHATVRDGSGRPTHLITQIQDIQTLKESERVLLDALEQQRSVADRLREIDAFRSELVETVSHELRTPLTSIRGYLELLSDQAASDLQRTMIDVASRNADRLAELVDNLLVLVRLDSADALGDLATADVDVAAAVSAAVDTVRPEVADRMQQLVIGLPDVPTAVRVDAEQLDRVLINLLSNASKYTPDGGRIDLAVVGAGQHVRIEVSDTGIGIPEAEQSQLFQRFFRASTARQHAIVGNGLGLTIVKAIVERHEGTVEFTSCVGAGSRFVVTLPAAARVPIGTDSEQRLASRA